MNKLIRRIKTVLAAETAVLEWAASIGYPKPKWWRRVWGVTRCVFRKGAVWE